MTSFAREVRELKGIAPESVPYGDLLDAGEPVILKGLASKWPLVQTGSPTAAAEYLKACYGGQAVLAFIGRPGLNGCFGYTEDATQLDFKSERGYLGEYLDLLLAHLEDEQAPSWYIGSTDVDAFFPGLRSENDLILNHEMFQASPPMVGAWIGNRTTALAHHDFSHNIACNLVGRRRFVLFPPEQVENLYPGPLDPTPGGQVVTMADIDSPDFERFPRLAKALGVAQVAYLDPGDVLYYPAMWWHQVNALESFNVMVNYWWNLVPAFMDSPQNTMMHALLSLRSRPEAEKKAWRAMFDYYIFGPAEQATDHLPEPARGNLGPLDELKARRLRSWLLRRLNR